MSLLSISPASVTLIDYFYYYSTLPFFKYVNQSIAFSFIMLNWIITNLLLFSSYCLFFFSFVFNPLPINNYLSLTTHSVYFILHFFFLIYDLFYYLMFRQSFCSPIDSTLSPTYDILVFIDLLLYFYVSCSSFYHFYSICW